MAFNSGVQKAAKCRTDLKGKTVDLLVGPEKVLFQAHRGVLVKSQWFQNALKKEWKESRGEIQLPSVETEPFELFLYWLYLGQIDVDGNLSNQEQFKILHHAWVLGDFLQDTPFKDAVIQQIIDRTSESSFPRGLAAKIYDQTTESSAWRQLYIDIHAFFQVCQRKPLELDCEDVQSGPKEFFVDLTRKCSMLCTRLNCLESRARWRNKTDCRPWSPRNKETYMEECRERRERDELVSSERGQGDIIELSD